MPAFHSVPSYQEGFEVEDPEWVDTTDFYPEVVPSARDPIFNSVLAGTEAEAMILKYGGDLHTPAEPAPLAATHSASLFCASLPVDTGMKLPPDFAREFDRVSVAGNNRQVCTSAKNFAFRKNRRIHSLSQRRLQRN